MIHSTENQDRAPTILVLGIPFDANSSYLRGAAQAPGKIRDALYCPSTNLCTESGLDLGSMAGWHFLPDLQLDTGFPVFDTIEVEVRTHLSNSSRLICLGGDHSITLPILRGHAAIHQDLNVLHFDAHPDLYDELDGNPFSHACPFARILEQGLVKRLVQAGIRTMTPHQREQAERFGVEVIPMNEIERLETLRFDGPLYLSIDLDCLDPAFAPGVSHQEPGGLSTRELLHVIQELRLGREGIVGADIVEYNPTRDLHTMTAMVAAKLLKELLARMLPCARG